jgi:phosphate transport system ATP-binding protein
MKTKIKVDKLNLYYGNFHALKDISTEIPQKQVTAIIGPSGCGKSTMLRVFNRMNDLIEGVRTTGQIFLDGQGILGPKQDLVSLRKKVGMVFQRPNPFPLSVFENVAFGLRIHGSAARKEVSPIVEECLRAVLLWEDLKDRLHSSALRLSLEQKQRLCIARLLAVKPDVLLMDEPCSALDPVSTSRIEELMEGLKKNYTIVIVTHNMQQAARISQCAGFMLLGELIEMGETQQIFTTPKDNRTQDYITGRFG